MTFDPAVPVKLKRTQKWFASIITRPIDEDSRMNPISPRGDDMEEEAWDFIKPSPTLRPAQRIELYNQQYWWRLLSVLQENFPFLTRLFGFHDFNQTIAFPYMVKYPSRHWSLNLLGDRLVQWIEEEYHADDKNLVLTAAAIDWAYCHSFSAEEASPLTAKSLPVAGEVDSLMTAQLSLQPHIKLFALDANYFELRDQMLNESVEHWTNNDFPRLDKKKKNYYFILYRNLQTNLVWNLLSEAEYALLSRFKEGASVEETCAWLEKQRKASFKNAEKHIQNWFKEWAGRRWLTLKGTKTASDSPCREKKTTKKKATTPQASRRRAK